MTHSHVNTLQLNMKQYWLKLFHLINIPFTNFLHVSQDKHIINKIFLSKVHKQGLWELLMYTPPYLYMVSLKSDEVFVCGSVYWYLFFIQRSNREH